MFHLFAAMETYEFRAPMAHAVVALLSILTFVCLYSKRNPDGVLNWTQLALAEIQLLYLVLCDTLVDMGPSIFALMFATGIFSSMKIINYKAWVTLIVVQSALFSVLITVNAPSPRAPAFVCVWFGTQFVLVTTPLVKYWIPSCRDVIDWTTTDDDTLEKRGCLV